MLRKSTLVLLLILLSLTLLTACEDNPTSQVVVITATPSPTTPTAPVAASTTALTTTQAASGLNVGQIGQPVSVNGYILTVNSVEKTIAGDNSKPNGLAFVALDVTIASDKDKGVSVSVHFAKLISQTGLSYDGSSEGKKPSLDIQDDLPKGQKVRGWINFVVSKDAHSLLFQYMPGFDGKTTILVDVGI